jgi:5-methylcytosine-specific restriction protein A
MPWAPKRHQTQQQPRGHAQTTGERGYDYAWQKLRLRLLKTSHALCHDCENAGIVTASAELHHLQKIKHRPDLRLDPENLVGLCRRHHQARTSRGE